MTIRFKLTMAFIAVIFVANALLSLVIVKHLGQVWLQEVQTRVRLDLNSARAVYDSHLASMTRFLQAAALHRVLVSGTAGQNRPELEDRLKRAHRQSGMDLLILVGADGRVIYRVRNPNANGDDLSGDPVVAAVLAQRIPISGTILLSRNSLEKEGADLAERARLTLSPTPKAKSTEDEVRTDGMVVAAAVPVMSPQGELVGVLYGGDLLNRRYEIVDKIRDEVFAHEVYEGKEIGTVTIFQGDLRISTNVLREDGTRAVGTRLSEVVYDEVLTRGGVWADRAFVVNDWYITAYEPIHDPTGRIIGALYVGLLEAPFSHRQTMIAGTFLAIVLLTTLGSLILLFFVTKLVLWPVSRIITMSRRTIDGDLSARVGIRPPGEMGILCQAIDQMADAVAEREEQLKLATQQQISRSEKLASIGRLAAGVAHEINNPLTGVLTFAHLLRQKENMTDQDLQDLDLIIHETTRAAEIVRGLLDFARERPAVKEPIDVNQAIRQTVRLIRSQKQFAQINIQEQLTASLPEVDGDMNQLQQVLLNLALNACEAMPDGGILTISTSAEEDKVFVKVTDTGAGIKKEHLDKIFEPFFSTKPVGKGTGLGLSVTYGIIQQHAGMLEVASEESQGTTFTIILPCVSQAKADRESLEARP